MANVVSKLVDEIKWDKSQLFSLVRRFCKQRHQSRMAMCLTCSSRLRISRIYGHKNELPRFTRHWDVNVSIDIDIEKTKDDGFLTDLFDASPVFDVKVQDRRGNELIIPNAKISERLRVTRRIPRKLKKSLKKKHGVYWVQHQPKTETVVTINSQN